MALFCSFYTWGVFHCIYVLHLQGLPSYLSGKGYTCNAGDPGSILGSGRFPGEWNGYPLQYSCLENSKDRGAWWAIVQGVLFFFFLLEWTEDPGGLQSTASHRVGHNSSDLACTHMLSMPDNSGLGASLDRGSHFLSQVDNNWNHFGVYYLDASRYTFPIINSSFQ